MPASADLQQPLLDLLRSHPGGVPEHTLLRTLRETGHSGFAGDAGDPLTLFRQHFLLFHHLYRLRDRLWAAGNAWLEIGPLRIRLHPHVAAPAPGLTERDALRDYYLDLDNLADTTADDVTELLGGFWRQLEGGDERRAALRALELEEPVDLAAIRHQYRRLAMRHHPDRGGDKVRLQAIQAAWALLRRHYGG